MSPPGVLWRVKGIYRMNRKCGRAHTFMLVESVLRGCHGSSRRTETASGIIPHGLSVPTVSIDHCFSRLCRDFGGGGNSSADYRFGIGTVRREWERESLRSLNRLGIRATVYCCLNNQGISWVAISIAVSVCSVACTALPFTCAYCLAIGLGTNTGVLLSCVKWAWK